MSRFIITATRFTALATVASLFATTAIAQEEPEIKDNDDIEEILEDWADAPAEAARALIDEYGTPDEITEKRLIWHDNRPWKRTEIVDEEIAHNFPEEHKDFLYQTVEFPVPEDKVVELAAFNGSLLIDRVKGEVTARCDREEANILTLNLMNQIIDGRKNAKSARDTHAETVLENKHQDLTQRLAFVWQQFDETADPGTVYGAPDRPDETDSESEDSPN